MGWRSAERLMGAKAVNYFRVGVRVSFCAST